MPIHLRASDTKALPILDVAAGVSGLCFLPSGLDAGRELTSCAVLPLDEWQDGKAQIVRGSAARMNMREIFRSVLLQALCRILACIVRLQALSSKKNPIAPNALSKSDIFTDILAIIAIHKIELSSKAKSRKADVASRLLYCPVLLSDSDCLSCYFCASIR